MLKYGFVNIIKKDHAKDKNQIKNLKNLIVIKNQKIHRN